MQYSQSNLKTSTWVALLVLSSAILSYTFACVTPFAALAAIAALTLPRKVGLSLVAISWALNQLTGFMFLSYPADSLLWGIAIGTAALLAFFVAQLAVNSLRSSNMAIICIATLLASFAAYQAALFIASLFLSGTENFSSHIVAQVFAVNAIAFAALLAANWLNSVAGFFPLPEARIFSNVR